jgi:hypothetical protein
MAKQLELLDTDMFLAIDAVFNDADGVGPVEASILAQLDAEDGEFVLYI